MGSHATGPRDFVLCVQDILDTHSFEVRAIKTNPGLIINPGFVLMARTSKEWVSKISWTHKTKLLVVSFLQDSAFLF